jgi:hypothetical protein
MRRAASIAAVALLVAMLLPLPQASSADAAVGSRMTFAEVPTGTTSSLPSLSLRGNQATDVVVLDAALWVMYRASDNSSIATYSPEFQAEDWNMSFEAYAPRTGNSYINMDPGRFGLQAVVSNGGSKAGIELCVGNRSSEGIYLIQGDGRAKVISGIQPAFPEGNVSDGMRPDRYVVSFEKVGRTLELLVMHSVAGLVFERLLDFDVDAPVIDIIAESDVRYTTGSYSRSINGGWMVDDLTVRHAGTPYPVLPFLWSTFDRNAPVSVQLVDANGAALDANVRIAGHEAARSGDRYQASYDRQVDWCAPTMVDVDLGNMRFRDRLQLTTTCSAPGAQIAQWWGGWDWVSVFGTDDCYGFETVASVYRGIDHPLTAYVMSPSGSSSEILPTQSELGLHLPHDFIEWKRRNWGEAVSTAALTHSLMNSSYTFASRWDDPSYVGRGDTYISLANPGSAATYELMFAQYLAGTRIEGGSSNQGDTIPGNYSIFGSWYVNWAPWWDELNHSWQPSRPIDMMDAMRQINTDNGNAPWNIVWDVAENGGLLRVYNHKSSRPTEPQSLRLLRWIADPKTDYPYENWKATDGEAASYVYARHTTEVGRNDSLELGYDVHRLDPRQAGYWLVPVTVTIDLGGRQMRSVHVIEHGTSGDTVQELKQLNGKRVMDIGYDVKDGKVMVSAFFNASATIVIDVVSENPHIYTYPSTAAYASEDYSYLAISTPSPSGRPLSWTFGNGTAPWLEGAPVGGASYLVSGVAEEGNYSLTLVVSDGFRSNSVNWTLSVEKRKVLVFNSTPEAVCAAGVYYEYQAVCDGATAWSVEGDGYWLEVDGSGLVHGFAPSVEAGKDFQVRIVASAGGMMATQEYSLHVNTNPADNQKVTLPFMGITVAMALFLVLILSYAFGKD